MDQQVQGGEAQADCLGGHRSGSRPASSHMKAPYEQKIQKDIGRAGKENEQQRPLRVPKTAKNAADYVVPHDKGEAPGADLQIAHRVRIRLAGDLHQGADRPRKAERTRRQREREAAEQQQGGLHRVQKRRPAPGAVVLPHQHGRACGQANGQAGERLHHLAARSHGGHGGRGGEASHHEQVDCAVKGLEQIRQ